MSMPGVLLALAICAALCGAAVSRSIRMQHKERADTARRPEPRWGADGGALPHAGVSAADDAAAPVADGGAFPLHRHRRGQLHPANSHRSVNEQHSRPDRGITAAIHR